MSWHLIKSESLNLDRKKALEFAAKHAGLPHSPTEREVDPARVRKLESVLRLGQALPFQWATVLYDGQVIRMNGQHSSMAIMAVGQEIPAKLSFHLDQFEADDRGGMVDLFQQFDRRWSSRTTQDISGAYQGLVADLSGCNRHAMKVAADGISWCKRTVQQIDAPAGDNTYDLMHVPFLTSFFLWFDGIHNRRKELLRKEIAAAIWQTYEDSQSGATKFWGEVNQGPDHFTDDMAPGSVLIGELYRAADEKEYREKEFPAPAFYYKKAIKAWGAFCRLERISSLKIVKAKKGQPAWPDVAHYNDASESEAA